MSTASLVRPGQAKRYTTARTFRIAMALALTTTAAATYAAVHKQQQAVARLEDGLSLVRQETASLRVRSDQVQHDPSLDAHLVTLDSGLAKLTATTDALQADQSDLRETQSNLRATQGDMSEELGHIRAEVANADIGIAQLRSSLDERDAGQHKAIADINGRVDQLQSAMPTEVTGAIPPLTGTISPAAPMHRRAQPPRPRWSVQDAWDGGAVITGRNRAIRVTPGTEVPGLGVVTDVQQRDNRWIVMTSSGVLVQR